VYVTFDVARPTADPTNFVGTLVRPTGFPGLSDAVYMKQERSLGGGARQYGFGIPLDDPDGLLVLGEKVYIGIVNVGDYVTSVPLHTCSAYTWFASYSPTNVTEYPGDGGTAYLGSIPNGKVAMAPVVMA